MLAVDAGVDLAALKVDVDARVAQGATAAVAGNNGLERERRETWFDLDLRRPFVFNSLGRKLKSLDVSYTLISHQPSRSVAKSKESSCIL